MKSRYQLILIIVAVLAIYYPSLFAQVNSIDDREMINNFINMGDWTLRGIFFPEVRDGLYFRPLIVLSYLFDKYASFLDPMFMHLHNILLHISNALLVFLLARQVAPNDNQVKSFTPLVSALIFALHPINTESVNWISGRTDILSCLFILISANLLVAFTRVQKKRYIIVSTIALLLATLAKETALAFLPGALLILFSREKHNQSKNRDNLLTTWLPAIVFGCGSVLIFFLVRNIAFSSNNSKISLTLKFIFNEPYDALFVVLRTFGFYMKKLFFPMPLNFAIVEIDPLYELLAIPLVLACIYIALRRTMLSALFVSGILFLFPSFVISFNQIAWTPYAERYVYISSAFISITVVGYLYQYIERVKTRYVLPSAVGTVLLVMLVVTLQRNVIWMTNLSLYADAVSKSPTFDKIRNEYGTALAKQGDFTAARTQYEISQSLSNFGSDEIPYINIALVCRKTGDNFGAQKIYEKLIYQKKGPSVMALQGIIDLLENSSRTIVNPRDIKENNEKLLNYNQMLYKLDNSPYTLYKMGQLSLLVGDSKQALEYFRSARQAFPVGSEFRCYSEKLISRLEKS